MEKGFTLVIPLYNKVNVFRETLDSVLNNHGDYPFKCIIVDDDSTDGSSEIALEYDRKYPDIFNYIKRTHHERKTPVFARNVGIKLAETEYIGFLDCDDLILPGFIDRGCNFLDEHPECNMYACGFINCQYNEKGEKYYTQFLAGNNPITDFKSYVINSCIDIHHSSHIYKTELVKQHLFTDCFNEDVVFKLKYVYYNPPIYFDNTTTKSFIWNIIYSNSENLWYREYSGIDKLFETLKEEIPGFEYEVKIIDGYGFDLIKK